MIDHDASSADLFGPIAYQFVQTFRQGKCPPVEKFARRYPGQADDIHDMLPASVPQGVELIRFEAGALRASVFSTNGT
jgi:hypothetical protein